LEASLLSDTFFKANSFRLIFTLLFLADVLFASAGDGFTADPPVIFFHLVDSNHCGLGILPQDLNQQLCHTLDEFRLFLSCYSVLGYPDVNIGQILSPLY
jgi:hypothetical protein